ncbi:MAG: TIGR00270 family protein [Thaumarchaeota archaeon]|nr:TIGR00270 family protein [Nitrososphaerota archaeon]
MPVCEICGANVKKLIKIEIDGAVFEVCPNCSKLGKPVKARMAPPPRKARPRRFELELPEVELKPDYSYLVKRARERLGLTQEELGRRIGEKPSVISHIETGKLRPDDRLARKLERFLGIELFEPLE